MKQSSEMKETKTVTVLETAEDKVTKFKIAYKEVKVVQRQEADAMPEPMEIDVLEGNNPSGNTYIFTIDGEAVTIKDEQGETVTGELADFLAKAEAPKGEFAAWRPSAADLFSERELVIGQSVTIKKEDAMAIIPNSEMLGNEMDVKVEAVLKSTTEILGNRCAVFDVTTTISGAPGGMSAAPGLDMKMTMKLSGTMTIGIDNMWLYKMQTSGPVNFDASMDSEEMSMTMTGLGDTTMDILNIYSKTKLEK